jgi:hypothetical protein
MRPLWMQATTSGDGGLWMDIRDSATASSLIALYTYEVLLHMLKDQNDKALTVLH